MVNNRDRDEANNHQTRQCVTRREVLTRSIAAASGIAGVALTALLPPASSPALAQGDCPVDTFPKIQEIARGSDGKLKAVLSIKNTQKQLPGYTGKQPPIMRYFEGHDQAGGPVWPAPSQLQVCLPGPTLRAKVGDRVEITFLNHTTPGQFAQSGLSIDNAETGRGTGCDMYTNAAISPPDNQWYPETRGDVFPNCFHASSTANLHFHGTHVSPDDFADNVLVQVRPDTTYTEQVAGPLFRKVFDYVESAHHIDWNDPKMSQWRKDQEKRVRNYDDTAIWKGRRGTPGHPALPRDNQLETKNAQLRAAGKWPEFFVGGYPSCFQITPAAGHKMGQAPGTHWYHAHKHGSTAIHLYNGLAGAFIIEGDYDSDLRSIYPDLDKTQKVIVIQRFTDVMDLERAANNNSIPVIVNGSLAGASLTQPGVTIPMRPGEVQLWRILNATAENTVRASFKNSANVVIPMFRQIAQDGVQFSLDNYQRQPLTQQDAATRNGARLQIAAGGRADILVKAPATAGTYSFIDPGQFPFANYVNVVVCGTPVNMDYPNEGSNAGKYPKFPDFLYDVGRASKTRMLDFGWEPYRLVSQPAASGTTHADPKNITQKATLPITVKVDGNDNFVINPNRAPYFTLDGVQFSEKVYGQTLVLDESEEWRIENTTSLRHPFHIHVNPFQLVEVFDPNDSTNNYKAETGGIWHDVILIPAAKTEADGQTLVIGPDGYAAQPGYVRIRSRYVDFTGDFVLHCHLLPHEDRGMMQLVRIIPGVSELQHH
jgi:FtsP/CotA-like multicopper oxidase with cupredoxin domain